MGASPCGDAVAACERPGSLDADICAAEPSDLPDLLARLPALNAIACNGAEAHRQASTALPGRAMLRLPSTSPAHASRSLADKCAEWAQTLRPWL